MMKRFFLLWVAAAVAVAAAGSNAPAWRDLFDGASLKGWKLSDFYKPGEVKVEKSFRNEGPAIVLEPGAFLTGIALDDAKDLPRTNYELSLEAMKVEGNDFFCGLTFPVRASACTLILGGWGGQVVGISSIDEADASENETTQGMTFAEGRWYKVRVRVTDTKIEVWLDEKSIIEVETAGKKISMRAGEIEESLPLGIAAYKTKAALRDIRIRKIEKP